MTLTSTRGSAVCLAAAAVLALSGCDSSPDGTATPAPTTDAVPVTSDAEPSTAPADDTTQTTAAPTLSAREQDQLDITTTLEEYSAALDAAKNGEASIEGIYPYSSATAREQWITQVMSYEAQGLALTGETSLDVADISIDENNAEVVACLDLSETDALNEDGESILPEDHLKQTLVEYVLVRNEDAETGWLVTEDVNQSEPCDG